MVFIFNYCTGLFLCGLLPVFDGLTKPIIRTRMHKLIQNKGGVFVAQNNEPKSLAQNTLDQIPEPASDARNITALVKEGGKVTGYQLSDNTVLDKTRAVALAREGGIRGVGIAHRGDTEYLKSLPDGSDNNNLSNLSSISPDKKE